MRSAHDVKGSDDRRIGIAGWQRFDADHLRAGRPAVHRGQQRIACVGRPVGYELDAAIGTVPHPPAEPQALRGLAHEPPEPDPLYPTRDTEVERRHAA